MGNSNLSDSNIIKPANIPIERKTASGVIWNFTAYGLSKGITLITLSIIARMLAKGDFGLVAVAVVALNYLAVFKDLGLGVALIQRRGNIESAANTVFTLNLAVGFLLTIIVMPIAPYIALYFGDPLLTPVLRWLGVSFLINAIGSIHIVLMKRELDFRRKLIPDFGNAFIKGIVSISMAYSGFGVWSLVFGQLSGAVASAIIVWIVFPWKPRISIDRSIVKRLIKFGSSVMGIDILSVLIENLPVIVIGRVCGLALLGVYSIAYRLPEILLISILWVMDGVIFPAFSMIQEQPEELRKGFLTSIRLVELVEVPLSLGLFIAADPIVRIFFGGQWVEAIPILRILAIYCWVYSIGFHAGVIYKAIGRPDILLKLSLLEIIIEPLALLVGSVYGLIGIALGHLAAIVIYRFVNLMVAVRVVDVTLFEIIRQLKPAVQGGFVLLLFALPVLYYTENINPVLRLLMVAFSGASGYLGTLYLFEKKNLLYIVRLFNKSN